MRIGFGKRLASLPVVQQGFGFVLPAVTRRAQRGK
jgi:hypothetical protein